MVSINACAVSVLIIVAYVKDLRQDGVFFRVLMFIPQIKLTATL